MWEYRWCIDGVIRAVIGGVICNIINYIYSWKKGSVNGMCLRLVHIRGGRGVRMVCTCDIRVNRCVLYLCIGCGICACMISARACVCVCARVCVWVHCMCIECINRLMWTSKYKSINLKWKHWHLLFIRISVLIEQ